MNVFLTGFVILLGISQFVQGVVLYKSIRQKKMKQLETKVLEIEQTQDDQSKKIAANKTAITAINIQYNTIMGFLKDHNFIMNKLAVVFDIKLPEKEKKQ